MMQPTAAASFRTSPSKQQTDRETMIISTSVRVEQIMAIRIPRGIWAALLTALTGLLAGLLIVAAIKY
jgi:hypothetical protein